MSLLSFASNALAQGCQCGENMPAARRILHCALTAATRDGGARGGCAAWPAGRQRPGRVPAGARQPFPRAHCATALDVLLPARMRPSGTPVDVRTTVYIISTCGWAPSVSVAVSRSTRAALHTSRSVLMYHNHVHSTPRCALLHVHVLLVDVSDLVARIPSSPCRQAQPACSV